MNFGEVYGPLLKSIAGKGTLGVSAMYHHPMKDIAELLHWVWKGNHSGSTAVTTAA